MGFSLAEVPGVVRDMEHTWEKWPYLAGIHSSIVNLGQIRGNGDFEVFLMGPRKK